jgi:hypothetical protein
MSTGKNRRAPEPGEAGRDGLEFLLERRVPR